MSEEKINISPSPLGRDGGGVYFAPGRINLIGEHLDYNGGLVLPAALTLGVKLTITPRTDNEISLRSATHSFATTIQLGDAIEYNQANQWCNYPLGVIAHLINEGYSIPACDLYYESTLPEGSGLSSSAAVEVVTAYALIHQIYTPSPSGRVGEGLWLANFCKQVENQFIGVQCGIMDQYSVALGKKDNAILIDCHQLKHQYIPIELDEYAMLILDSKKPRSLIASKYNERKAECEAALKIIQTTQPDVTNLCEAEIYHLDLLNDDVLYRRTKHVISENLRVKECVKVLKYNDLSTFGRLMNASQESMKNDYEITGLEMDTLVETAQQTKGCLGARMTGGGFGGCAIAIVHHSAIDTFTQQVSEKYHQVTGLNCEIYKSEIGDGVRLLNTTDL